MLPGLSRLEIGRLQMSVGYGTHKKGRPLSPVEVGTLLKRAHEAGASLHECARVLNLNGTSQVNRFLRMLRLPENVRHLVDWGRSSNSIGFTTAVELARVSDPADQRALSKAIIEESMQTAEVRQVAQTRLRSGRPIADCLKEVIGMRPTIERHYVFIGAVGHEGLQAGLAELTQAQRNVVLVSALEALGIAGVSGRLGEQVFTIVGDERFNSELRTQGKAKIEARIRSQLWEDLRGVRQGR